MILNSKRRLIRVFVSILLVGILLFVVTSILDRNNKNNEIKLEDKYMVSREEFSFQIQTAFNNVKEIGKIIKKESITENEANYVFTVIGLSVNSLGGIYYCEGESVKKAYLKYAEHLMNFFKNNNKNNYVKNDLKLKEEFFEAYKDYMNYEDNNKKES